MNGSTFIGIGKNPEGKDLPLGLGMHLAQDPKALDTFSNLSQQQRDSIITHIQSCTTSEDARARIAQVVDGLKNGNSFF